MGKGDRNMTGKEVMTGDAASIHQIVLAKSIFSRKLLAFIFYESCKKGLNPGETNQEWKVG